MAGFDTYICCRCDYFGEDYDEETGEETCFCNNWEGKEPPAFCPERKITKRFSRTFEHTIRKCDEYEFIGELNGIDRMITMQPVYRKDGNIIIQNNDAAVVYFMKTGVLKCKVRDPKYIGARVYVFVVYDREVRCDESCEYYEGDSEVRYDCDSSGMCWESKEEGDESIRTD